MKEVRRLLGRVIATYFEATDNLGVIALVLGAAGVLCVFAELQSPSFLLWTGHRVRGLELGDTVNYQFRGAVYTMQVQGRPEDAGALNVTVYL